MASISSVLTLSMLWQFILRPLIVFFGTGAVFKSFVSVPTAVVFAPVPTAYRLLAGPFVRWCVFAQTELLHGEQKHLGRKRATAAVENGGGADAVSGGGGGGGAAAEDNAEGSEAAATAAPSTAGTADSVTSTSTASGAVAAQLRKRRPKKVTKENKEQQKSDVLLGRGIAGTQAGATADNDDDEEYAADELPESLWKWIERRPRKPTTQDQDRAHLRSED
eukprot:SAG22_NODE_13_length_33548_cov_57.167773_27_plen_221_part_00